MTDWREEGMSEIYTLAIACVGGSYLQEDYQFVLEVPGDLMLGDLASHILQVVAFEETDHLDEFYLANANGGGRRTSLIPDQDFENEDDGMDLMLAEVFPLPKNKKLYYYFDFGASWCFQITRRGKATAAQPGLDYPRVVSESGVKPKQFGDDDEEEFEDEDDDEDDED